MIKLTEIWNYTNLDISFEVTLKLLWNYSHTYSCTFRWYIGDFMVQYLSHNFRSRRFPQCKFSTNFVFFLICLKSLNIRKEIWRQSLTGVFYSMEFYMKQFKTCFVFISFFLLLSFARNNLEIRGNIRNFLKLTFYHKTCDNKQHI